MTCSRCGRRLFVRSSIRAGIGPRCAKLLAVERSQQLELSIETAQRSVHFHDLRGLAATKCRSLKEAQALLGHTTDAMTRKCYWMAVDRVQPLSMSAIQA